MVVPNSFDSLEFCEAIAFATVRTRHQKCYTGLRLLAVEDVGVALCKAGVLPIRKTAETETFMDEGMVSAPMGSVNGAVAHESSGVSWSAIIAGAAATTAFALILLTLGSGLGLGALSPWAPGGQNAVRFGFAAAIWVCVTQILTSGLGGYLAGRLRKRWLGLHTDETYFRDTAHGFLSWAVATLLAAGLLVAAIAGVFNAGAQASIAAPATSPQAMERGNAAAAADVWPVGYYVDSLFRMPAGATVTGSGTPADWGTKQEVVRIFLNSLAYGDRLSTADAQYVGQVVARRTGLSQSDAQRRVDDTYTGLQMKMAKLKDAAKQAADAARKATVYASLWLFVSLLMGAFSASLMATIGGRQRDAIDI